MPAGTLAQLKLYMRIDHDEDDDVILALWNAAVEYLGNAGIVDDGKDLYWLAAAGLCLHWYDAAPSVTGSGDELPLGLRQIINQLKLISKPGR